MRTTETSAKLRLYAENLQLNYGWRTQTVQVPATDIEYKLQMLADMKFQWRIPAYTTVWTPEYYFSHANANLQFCCHRRVPAEFFTADIRL